MPPNNPSPQPLHCMEVWGGSHSVDRTVEMAGLDAWVYSKPFQSPQDIPSIAPSSPEISGGDVYYASSCATGRIHRLLLADVSGHGQAVSDIARVLRSLMRRYVNCIDQQQFVRSMNRHFTQVSVDGLFATALVTTYFAPTRMLSVCNAGHPRPLLYRADLRQWSFLERKDSATDTAPDAQNSPVHNIPLGILDLAEYQQFDTQLNPNDLILCYTDALTESKSPDGQLLGEHRLLQIVRDLPPSEPRAFIASLLAHIQSLHPDNLQTDDVTLLLLRPTAQTRPVTLGQKLLASGRFLAELLSGHSPFPDLKLPNIGGAIFPSLSKRWRGAR